MMNTYIDIEFRNLSKHIKNENKKQINIDIAVEPNKRYKTSKWGYKNLS